MVSQPTEPNGQRSLGQLVSDLSEQTARLVRAEIDLAKAEVTARLQQAGIGIGLLVGAALFAFFVACTAITTAILGLAVALPAWLSALIITVVLLVIAAILGLLGVRRLKAGMPPKPAAAQQSLKSDVSAVKEAISE